VALRQRIRETRRAHPERQAAANDRPAALGLIDREVDALIEESPEDTLDVMLSNETLEVAELAPHVPEELPVNARWMTIHRVAREREEALLAPREPPRHDLARLGWGQRVPQEGRKVAGEPDHGPALRAEVAPDRNGRRHLCPCQP
jgi:hypothetical protein